eukprot:maker-scaffold592_size129239-snap-gene-0.18 protein:Tk10856 transcript:maker-scaffold592_size129239-snap-gene-0.18-mRNA-1 annotation:"hypothetical protein L798_07567"
MAMTCSETVITCQLHRQDELEQNGYRAIPDSESEPPPIEVEVPVGFLTPGWLTARPRFQTAWGLSLALISGLIFTFNGSLLKTYQIDPVDAMTVRGVVQCLIMGLIVWARGLSLWPSHASRLVRGFVLLQGFIGSLMHRLGLWKLIFIGCLLVGIIFVIQPPVLFPERPTNETHYLLEGDASEAGGMAHDFHYYIGALLALASSILGSINNVCVSGALKQINSMILVFYTGLFCCVIALLATLFDHKQRIYSADIALIEPGDWAILFTMAGLGILAYFSVIKALQLVDPTQVSVLRSVEIIFAFGVQVFIMNQHPDVFSVLGSSLVLTAIVLIAFEGPIITHAPSCLPRPTPAPILLDKFDVSMIVPVLPDELSIHDLWRLLPVAWKSRYSCLRHPNSLELGITWAVLKSSSSMSGPSQGINGGHGSVTCSDPDRSQYQPLPPTVPSPDQPRIFRFLGNHPTLRNLLGLILALFSGVIFTASSFLIQWCHVDFVEAALVRSVLQTLVMVILTKFLGQSVWPSDEVASALEKTYLIVQGLVGGAMTLLGYAAIAMIPLGDALTLFFASPLFAAVFGHILLGHRLKLWKMSFSVLLLCGVTFVVRPPMIFPVSHPYAFRRRRSPHGIGSLPHDDAYFFGSGLALLGALLGGVYSVLSSGPLRRLNSQISILYVGVFTFLLAIFATEVDHKQRIFTPFIANISAQEWGHLIAIASLGIVAYFSVFLSLQLVDGTIVSILRSSEIVLAFLAQSFLLHETPSQMGIFGASLVLISVVMISLEATI